MIKSFGTVRWVECNTKAYFSSFSETSVPFSGGYWHIYSFGNACLQVHVLCWLSIFILPIFIATGHGNLATPTWPRPPSPVDLIECGRQPTDFLSCYLLFFFNKLLYHNLYGQNLVQSYDTTLILQCHGIGALILTQSLKPAADCTEQPWNMKYAGEYCLHLENGNSENGTYQGVHFGPCWRSSAFRLWKIRDFPLCSCYISHFQAFKEKPRLVKYISVGVFLKLQLSWSAL